MSVRVRFEKKEGCYVLISDFFDGTFSELIMCHQVGHFVNNCNFYGVRFAKMLEPLMDRRAKLERTKRLHQFLRDIEDEKMWISEKLPLAQSTEYGNSLLSVQMLQKKNKSLQNEVDSHEPRVISVVDLGLSMIEEGHPQSDEFQKLIDELNTLWAELLAAVQARKDRLELSELTQQVCSFLCTSRFY